MGTKKNARVKKQTLENIKKLNLFLKKQEDAKLRDDKRRYF